MTLPNQVTPLFTATSGPYTVGRSLRFRSSASAYLNRTPSVAGNRQKWTYSFWVKRGVLTTNCFLLQSNVNSNAGLTFTFDTDRLSYGINGVGNWFTTAVFRDPSAWYHIVLAFDSTQATAANRLIAYVNNVSYTFSANSIVQNNSYDINNNTIHYIGRSNTGDYFDGYMAEIYMVDGQQLTPSSFGAYDTNGVWQPKKYSGTYGTNGFYLPFSNTTSTTTLVQDSSGNSNNWTPNNISLTAGTTYDSMIDSPTVSASSSNYCVMNPVSFLNSGSLSNGNLTYTTGVADAISVGTFGVSSGKWYWEVTATTVGASSGAGIGIIGVPPSSLTVDITTAANGYAYRNNGQKGNNGSSVTYGATYTSGDVIGVALDMDGGTLTFYKNNVSQGTAYSSLSGTFTPGMGDLAGGFSGTTLDANFGQRPFTYTPPSGYSALNTYNLPTPTIKNGAEYMAATTYTGTGTTLSVNNGNNNTIGTTFAPNLVWIKARSNAYNHELYDTVRGATLRIQSNLSNAESTSTLGLTSFNSNGFTQGGQTETGGNGATYVGWQWKAGTASGSSNTSGSITSTVSVNTTAGFSIVTYTGTGSAATVGHGLGVAPSMIITKKRSSTSDWGVYHTSLGNTNYILLNAALTSAASSGYWNNTSPTSSVFSVASADPTNISAATYVAYCFAAVNGYSAFGKYTGNGSTDGPFVYTGFRPRWIMVKRTDAVGTQWTIQDTSRSPYNVGTDNLFANLTNSTDTTISIDILSNGFKLRNGDNSSNTSTGNYIYIAFAENPIKYSRAR